MPSGTKSQKVLAILSVYKRLKERFLTAFTSNVFCPRNIDNFAYSPSIGASGGLLTAWNSSMFDGSVVHVNSYDITVKMFSRLDNKTFHVGNIYGPSETGFHYLAHEF